MGTFVIFVLLMRIIAISTLRNYWYDNPTSEQPLKAWIQECKLSSWTNSAQLKVKYRNASIINSKRVVFNIKGNDFRLIVDIEYRLKIVFVVWIGSHVSYDKIDVETISYDHKTNKK